jgi:hypothetical protein
MISSIPSPLTSPQSETFHPNLSSILDPEAVEIIAAGTEEALKNPRLRRQIRINTEIIVRITLL